MSITRERVSGKCIVSVDDLTYFKTLGVLLGLEDFSNLKAGTTTTSPNMVDINRGLRSLDISYNIVDTTKNINHKGEYSNVKANVPGICVPDVEGIVVSLQ